MTKPPPEPGPVFGQTSPGEFPLHAHRRFARGRTWLMWQWSPTLGGVVWWGKPDAEDVRLHVTAMQYQDRGTDPMDALVDCSRLEAVEPAGFGELLGGITGQLPLWNRRVGKLVMLMPEGWVGALVSGLWHVLTPGFSWQVVNSMAAAHQALGRQDALEATLAVAGLIQECTSEEPLLVQLQAWLAAQPHQVNLQQAALELGASTRTLQRALAQAQTSFRQQCILAQRTRVERLLVETDDKIDAVALASGFTSLAHLSTQFKRWTGMSPSDYRARSRAGK